MVTRNNTQLRTSALPVVVIKINCLSLFLVWYLFTFSPVSSYVTRWYSWENLIFATASGNVSVISYGVSRGNHITFGFTLFSLNSVNSATII